MAALGLQPWRKAFSRFDAPRHCHYNNAASKVGVSFNSHVEGIGVDGAQLICIQVKAAFKCSSAFTNERAVTDKCPRTPESSSPTWKATTTAYPSLGHGMEKVRQWKLRSSTCADGQDTWPDGMLQNGDIEDCKASCQ